MSDLLEPLKYYTETKEKHASLVAAYFDKLVVESGIDVAAHKQTVEAYQKKCLEAEDVGDENGKYKAWRVILIILAVLAAVAGVLLIWLDRNWLGLLAIPLDVLFIWICIKKLTPKIRELSALHAKKLAEAEQLLAEAWAQMAPLNALFDNTDIHKLIEQVMPAVEFAPSLSPAHMELLRKEYDYAEMFDHTQTVLDTTAGMLCKSPFLFVRYQTQTMCDHRYQGSRTITYTTRVRDSNGNWRTVRRSQTLTAYVTKPKPHYETSTCLLFGNNGAPELYFSRHGRHVEDMSERKLERHIEDGAEDLQEKARTATQRGGNFQELANTEFEVLFGAHNRTNEVQFRVMYTPLAQENTTALLLDRDEGYGDDFSFIKNRRLNVIRSEHAQSWDMNTTAAHYRSYSLEEARQKFQVRNEDYFRSVFFDFAPLLAVPLYQDGPIKSLDEIPPQPSTSTPYEYEALANAIGWRKFVDSRTTDGAILKAKFMGRTDDTDRVAIVAHSYRTEDRVEYVPVWGGDGRMHDVPVHWKEYIPLIRKTNLSVQRRDQSDNAFAKAGGTIPQNGAYYHGLLAWLMI